MTDAKDKRKNYPDHFYWKYFEGWDITHDPSVEQREVFRARKDFENQKTKDYNAFIRKFY